MIGAFSSLFGSFDILLLPYEALPLTGMGNDQDLNLKPMHQWQYLEKPSPMLIHR